MPTSSSPLLSSLLPLGLSPEQGQQNLDAHFAPAALVGVDEVGRGPLAGPVVACAALLKTGVLLPPGLTDSKKLTARKREALYEQVQDACEAFAIAEASVEEIDATDILSANFLAMRRALQALGWTGLEAPAGAVPVFARGSLPKDRPCQLLVDGNLRIRGVPEGPQLPIVKGDGRVACIAAASVLAKVYRDRLMANLDSVYPGYDFAQHAGYGTAAHIRAIRLLGLSPVHRKTFKPKSLQGQLDLDL